MDKGFSSQSQSCRIERENVSKKKNKKNKKIASIVLSTRRSSVHVVCAPFGLFSRNSKSMRISVRFQTRIRTTVVSYSSIVE